MEGRFTGKAILAGGGSLRQVAGGRFVIAGRHVGGQQLLPTGFHAGQRRFVSHINESVAPGSEHPP